MSERGLPCERIFEAIGLQGKSGKKCRLVASHIDDIEWYYTVEFHIVSLNAR